MSSKPKVSSANWHNLFCDDNVKVYQDSNDSIFYKVILQGSRPKYFYNETAHSDVVRYCADQLGYQYWRILD